MGEVAGVAPRLLGLHLIMGEKLVQLLRHRLDLLGESFLDPGFLARADRRDGLAHAAERPQAVEGLDRGQRDEAEAEEAEGAHHRPAEDTDLLVEPGAALRHLDRKSTRRYGQPPVATYDAQRFGRDRKSTR